MKKLYRSTEDRFLAGLVGGIGEYFSVDPTLLRLGILIIAILTRPLAWVFIYCIGYLLVPERPTNVRQASSEEER